MTHSVAYASFCSGLTFMDRNQTSVFKPIRHSPNVANGNLNAAIGFVSKHLKIRLLWTKYYKRKKTYSLYSHL